MKSFLLRFLLLIFIYNFSFLIVCRSEANSLLAREQESSLLGERVHPLSYGESAFGLKSSWVRSEARYSSSGDKTSLGQHYEEKKVDTKGVYTERIEAETQSLQMIPHWIYALNEKWTLYFGLPLYSTQLKSKISKDYSSGSSLTSSGEGGRDNRKDLQSPTQQDSSLKVGQALFSTQYVFYQGFSTQLAVHSKLRFPSATKDDSVYYTQGAPDALGFGYGVGVLGEVQITSWIASLNLETTVNGSDRVYDTSTGDKMSRNPGDILFVRSMLTKKIFGPQYVSVGGSYTAKSADKANLNLESLERSEAYRMNAEIEYNPYRRSEGAATLPLSARLSYSRLLSGYNVNDESMASFDFLYRY